MKMFQIQFHTGFVPRNATTVKFAKYVHNFWTTRSLTLKALPYDHPQQIFLFLK